MNYLPHLKTMKITWWRISSDSEAVGSVASVLTQPHCLDRWPSVYEMCSHIQAGHEPAHYSVGWLCCIELSSVDNYLRSSSPLRHRHHSGWFCRTVTPNLQVIVSTTLPFSWEPFCASQSIHINSGCSLEPSPHCCHLIYTTWRRLEMKYISTVSAQ